MKRRLALLVFVLAALSVLIMPVATAGRLWCAKDPPVVLNGEVWNIELQLQDSQLGKLTGTPLLRLHVNPATDPALLNPHDSAEPVFGAYGLQFEIVEDASYPVNQAELTVTVPANGNLNTRLLVTTPAGQTTAVTGSGYVFQLE